MVSPKGSNLETSGKLPNLVPKPPGAAICSFSIPLITIVANFVLRLFLPIVIFVFQLWWMLALRFCISPVFSLSASVAAGLKAHLDANVDATFAADVKANVSDNLGIDAATQIQRYEFSPGFQADFSGTLSADLFRQSPSRYFCRSGVLAGCCYSQSTSIAANLKYSDKEVPLP